MVITSEALGAWQTDLIVIIVIIVTHSTHKYYHCNGHFQVDPDYLCGNVWRL